MDISALLSTMVSSDSIGNISKVTGAKKADVQSVLSAALPLLIEGAGKQAEGKDTVEGFTGALEQHAQNDTSDIKAFMKGVDLEDGAKIVAHLLGKKNESAQKSISKDSGVSGNQVGSIMAAAAPLLMSLLGQQSSSSSTETTQSAANPTAGLIGALLKNVDITSLLFGLLGGGSSSAAPAQAAEPVEEEKKEDNSLLGSIASGLVGSLLKK